MGKTRYGILGGTFNPVHEGHLHMARCAAKLYDLQKVIMLPSGNPPHKTDIADKEDRWRMLCAACAREPLLEPSRMELDREGTTYTVDTLTILKNAQPKAEIYYIIGADTLPQLKTWKNYQQVLKLCTFLVVPRIHAGADTDLLAEQQQLRDLGAKIFMLDMVPKDVSSTDIREAIAAGNPTPLLPTAVRSYCHAVGLYGHAGLPEAGEWMKRLFRTMNRKRFAHTLNVAYTAINLANVHGEDAVKAEAAALLHDCAKCLPLCDLQKLCEGTGIDPAFSESDNVLHGYAGSVLARTEYGVTDPEILSAIACHTTGKPGMSRLDMIVCLADSIEPSRADYPLLSQIRCLAVLSLEKAMLVSLEGTVKHVKASGYPLYPVTRDTLVWLKKLLQEQSQ